MKWSSLVPGTFIRRDNRFQAAVLVGGAEAKAHVPNSGRLGDLFIPGQTIWLTPQSTDQRKTAYDLVLVEHASVLVSVDARLPNRLFLEALTSGIISGLSFSQVRAEIRLGDSRFDFCLIDEVGNYWVETKSVTLVENGCALFPDAPTSRGRRHLRALIQALEHGDKGAVIFVVQRPDARSFSPNQMVDAGFARSLQEAVASGVDVRAFCCQVSLEEIYIRDEIPVVFAP